MSFFINPSKIGMIFNYDKTNKEININSTYPAITNPEIYDYFKERFTNKNILLLDHDDIGTTRGYREFCELLSRNKINYSTIKILNNIEFIIINFDSIQRFFQLENVRITRFFSYILIDAQLNINELKQLTKNKIIKETKKYSRFSVDWFDESLDIYDALIEDKDYRQFVNLYIKAIFIDIGIKEVSVLNSDFYSILNLTNENNANYDDWIILRTGKNKISFERITKNGQFRDVIAYGENSWLNIDRKKRSFLEKLLG